MKLSEKFDGLFYLFVSFVLMIFSFYSVYHAFFFERWSILLLSIFLFLFAITLALYGISRRIYPSRKKAYQQLYHWYLLSQLFSFLYLFFAGFVLSFYLNRSYGIYITFGGIGGTISCLIALYFYLRKEGKKRPEIE